jgi:hypothetical protein
VSGCCTHLRKEEAERLKHGMRLWREVLIPIVTLLIGIIGTYLAEGVKRTV